MHFTPLNITAIDRVNANSSIFTFAIPANLKPFSAEVNKDAIQSVYVVQPDIQIQRPFTPLDGACFSAPGASTFQLLVKRYDDGETSKWLHRRQPGEQVKFRGPVPTWIWTPEVSSIAFIAGGTGITPFIQLVRLLSAKKLDTHPELNLIYASTSPEHILHEKELQDLVAQYPGKVTTHLVVDGNPSRAQTTAKTGQIDIKDLKKWLPKPQANTRLLVCGPEGMIEAIAGPRPRSSHATKKIGGLLEKVGGWDPEQVERL